MWRDDQRMDYWSWFEFVLRRCFYPRGMFSVFFREAWHVRHDMIGVMRKMQQERDDCFYLREWADGDEVSNALRHMQRDIDAELAVSMDCFSGLKEAQKYGLVDSRAELIRKLEFLQIKLRELNYEEFVVSTKSDALKETAQRIKQGAKIADRMSKIKTEPDFLGKAEQLQRFNDQYRQVKQEHAEELDAIEALALVEKAKILE